LKSDTCNRCDALNTKIKALPEGDEKRGFNRTGIAHRKATTAKERKDEDTAEAKYDQTKKGFNFGPTENIAHTIFIHQCSLL
jgi:hypothetical protein